VTAGLAVLAGEQGFWEESHRLLQEVGGPVCQSVSHSRMDEGRRGGREAGRERGMAGYGADLSAQIASYEQEEDSRKLSYVRVMQPVGRSSFCLSSHLGRPCVVVCANWAECDTPTRQPSARVG
jgi:hypothetical protein